VRQNKFPKSWYKSFEVTNAHPKGVQADLAKRETPHKERPKTVLAIEGNDCRDVERTISDTVEEPAYYRPTSSPSRQIPVQVVGDLSNYRYDDTCSQQ
jgi:hypothetical protein